MTTDAMAARVRFAQREGFRTFDIAPRNNRETITRLAERFHTEAERRAFIDAFMARSATETGVDRD